MTTVTLEVGQKATRSMDVTADHVKAYATLTGDYNPLHFDEAFCAKTRFGRLVAQGGLTTGLLHALVAMDMPGPGTVFLSQNWKFTAPVYIGDTITAEADRARGARDQAGVAARRSRFAARTASVVLDGEAWCYRMQPAA